MGKIVIRNFRNDGLIFPPFKGAWDFGFFSADSSAVLSFHKAIIAKVFSYVNADYSIFSNPLNFQNSIINFLQDLSKKEVSRLPVKTSLRPAFFVFRQNPFYPSSCYCNFTYDISNTEKFRFHDWNKFIYRVKFVK